MSKIEFLEGLRKALSSTGSRQLIEDNITYYSNYIDDQVSGGRSQGEVLDELGDPRLIAKSIMDAAGYDEPIYDDDNQSQFRDTSSDYEGQEDETPFGNIHIHTFSKWQAYLIMILLAAIVIAVFWLIGTVIGGILSFIGPMLGPIFAIMIIMCFIKIFRR